MREYTQPAVQSEAQWVALKALAESWRHSAAGAHGSGLSQLHDKHEAFCEAADMVDEFIAEHQPDEKLDAKPTAKSEAQWAVELRLACSRAWHEGYDASSNDNTEDGAPNPYYRDGDPPLDSLPQPPATAECETDAWLRERLPVLEKMAEANSGIQCSVWAGSELKPLLRLARAALAKPSEPAEGRWSRSDLDVAWTLGYRACRDGEKEHSPYRTPASDGTNAYAKLAAAEQSAAEEPTHFRRIGDNMRLTGNVREALDSLLSHLEGRLNVPDAPELSECLRASEVEQRVAAVVAKIAQLSKDREITLREAAEEMTKGGSER